MLEIVTYVYINDFVCFSTILAGISFVATDKTKSSILTIYDLQARIYVHYRPVLCHNSTKASHDQNRIGFNSISISIQRSVDVFAELVAGHHRRETVDHDQTNGNLKAGR